MTVKSWCRCLFQSRFSLLFKNNPPVRYSQVILVSGCPVLIAVNWLQQWCAVSFLWAPKLARKCESKHWFPCGADGRSVARCTVTWLPNFLGWIDLLSYRASPRTRGTSRRAWSSAIKSIKTSLLHGVFNSTSLRHWRSGLFNKIRTGHPSLYRNGAAWPSLIFR